MTEHNIDEYLLTCDKNERAMYLDALADDLDRWVQSIRGDKPPCCQCGGCRTVLCVREHNGYLESHTEVCALCVAEGGAFIEVRIAMPGKKWAGGAVVTALDLNCPAGRNAVLRSHLQRLADSINVED